MLWDPLPDPLPTHRGRFPRLSQLAAAVSASAPSLSAQELVNRRVRRGAVQALVQKAYLDTVGEQDDEQRGPSAFAEAWHDCLADLLAQATVDLPGWATVTVADLDIDLAWRLYALASNARQNAIETVTATRSRRVQRGQQVPTFEFSIVSDGGTLGDVIYGICQPCRAGLLYKIGFPTDWQYCGFGRLALSQLEARHPDLTWYTTADLL